MKEVELLAPAGNFECLKAAINNGANAVYLGGKNFSARAFANNFDEQEIIEAVNYAHLRNVKVYVTLNTLLNENEFNNAIKMVKFYYENNVDALLIQDFGLYYYIRNNFPDFEIHCSTQMHVHNLEGVITAKKLGFKRVVLARESTLEFIGQACKQDIEIETFVHGAICVSYSGQCLMSSVTKNRSANKGMCAQCCRLKYLLKDQNGNQLKTDTDYLISPKDMCLVDRIPELIEAGVSSFKIEGRLKSPAYVGYVTSIYRKAIDSYYKSLSYKLSNQELENLKVLFNRNFTSTYLDDNNDLFGQSTPNHLGIKIGDAFKFDGKYTYIKLSNTLNQFDGIRINEFGCIVNMLYKNDLLVNKGLPNEVVQIKTDRKYIGTVYKTIDYQLENSICSVEDKKLDLDLNITIKPNLNVIVKLKCQDNEFIYRSDIIAEKALKQPISEDNVKTQFSKLNDTVYKLNSINIDTSDAFLPLKQLNDIRRNAISAFDEYRLNSFSREMIEFNFKQSIPSYDEQGEIVIQDDEARYSSDVYDFNYPINKNSIYSQNNSAVITEIGGLLKDYKNKIAYYTLNCSNSYCYEFFKKLGYKAIILSSELNKLDINTLISAYKNRFNVDIKPYVLQKGNRVLMYIKANPFDKYIDLDHIYTLEDQNNSYIIHKKYGLTELVENNIDINDVDYSKQLFIIYK